jgi:NADPH2:quinone reductase
MRAARVETLDGPGAIVVGEVPDPQAAPGEVLIEVHAAGVTFPDVLQSQGLYQVKPELPFIPGQVLAGVVLSAPSEASAQVGDRVAALSLTGAFAELATAPSERVFPLPDRVSFAAGAGVAFNYLTAHFAFTERGRLSDGETVLVHGAGGGLGSAAVQLARALGARVIAVVSTAQKGDIAWQAGAHDVVAVDGFLPAVRELTGGRGVDIVFDPVGGDRVTDSLRSLATQGRLLVIGFTGGEIPTVRLNRLLLNNIDVVGVGWGAYALARRDYVQEEWREIAAMLDSGALDPVIGATYPLADAAAAVGALANRQALGNVVLTTR